MYQPFIRLFCCICFFTLFPHMAMADCASLVGSTQPAGSGTEASPYQISSLQNLCWLSEGDGGTTSETVRWQAHYELTQNIDATATSSWNSGSGFSPIGNGTTAFKGSFDGEDYTITGIFISSPADEYQGFFGYTETTADITDLILKNITVEGRRDVGGVVGWNRGLLEDCSVTGTITGSEDNIGGVAGYNADGIIEECSFSGDVTGVVAGGITGQNKVGSRVLESSSSGTIEGQIAGGLIGMNNGIVTDSWSSATVEGMFSGKNYAYAGGLVGTLASGDIQTSYATGEVTAQISNTGSADGASYAGGLVAMAYGGDIEDSFALGNATASAVNGGSLTAYAGGLVGYLNSSGTIKNTYSTGKPTATATGGTANTSYQAGLVGYREIGTTSLILNSFWDRDTSQVVQGINNYPTSQVRGLTTLQMKDVTQYTTAGWNMSLTPVFAQHIWGLDTTGTINNGYPYLVLEDEDTDSSGSSGGSGSGGGGCSFGTTGKNHGLLLLLLAFTGYGFIRLHKKQ